MKELILKGKIWVITDDSGELINDIDTDQIYHNAFLHITDISEMGKYAFGNLQGWNDFSKKASKDDILLVGSNFGAGSSRQQAVDCFRALGISAIVAISFGAIYKRNAINSGFPILTLSNLNNLVKSEKFKSGDMVELNLEKGIIKNTSDNSEYKTDPFSKVQKDIYMSGNLFRSEK
jgi:3-isopropylmalate/(R)-2-methylmalate dehydratase small subunit